MQTMTRRGRARPSAGEIHIYRLLAGIFGDAVLTRRATIGDAYFGKHISDVSGQAP